MKKALFLFLIFSIASNAQFKAIVKDSITHRPIAYAGIWFASTDYAISTNKEGVFETKKMHKNDTLVFFTTGYKTKKILCSNLDQFVFLSPKSAIAPSILTPNRKLKKYIENDDFLTKNNKQFFSTDSITQLVAQYLPFLPEYENQMFLKDIQFAIQSDFKILSYKVRFFEAGIDGKPGAELLNEAIFGTTMARCYFDPKYKNALKYSVNEKINLKKNRIVFPKNGLFIALELPFSSENDCHCRKNGSSIINPLVMITPIKNDAIWEFHFGEWRKIKDSKEVAFRLTLED